MNKFIYGMSHKKVHLGQIQPVKCNEANKTPIKLTDFNRQPTIREMMKMVVEIILFI